jgi:pilus assembly protein Flp/PilA
MNVDEGNLPAVVLGNQRHPKSATVNATTGSSMTKVFNIAKHFIADEDGAALIEYTVLIGVMLIAVIATILAVGNWVNTKWTALNTNLAASP